ncbi:AIR synthase family protein [Fervidicoccus fontis]|uniref:AIR synthase family protein n=1 Tax=Fervidicoccus fontis TaxID=683846 RepID=A0A843AA46_9CREN|nr:AIR synthase family protein [Fervidicoccus fontis]MBE9391763.1 AIR synthase family protein [Fervidicoccus fontis]
MSLFKLGKLPNDIFDRIIYPNIGLLRDNVMVRPKHGVDVGVFDIGEYSIIVKTDPVFVVPEYGWEKSAWFAVHILASDVSTSGNPAQYMAIDLNLPKKITKEQFSVLWSKISDECKKLGISIVAGHTGIYDGTDYPMIGGATVLSVAKKGNYVTTEMAEEGDLILMTKGPAIEAVGILSTMYPEIVEKEGGNELRRKGESFFYKMSVVEDALSLSSLGLRTAITSMHDATEYGVWGALHDISRASNSLVEIQEESLFIDDDVEKILRIFEEKTKIPIDPYASISEGTLIATVKKEYADQAIDVLSRKGIKAGIIGRIREKGKRGVYIKGKNTIKELKFPEEDPFWKVFFALNKK